MEQGDSAMHEELWAGVQLKLDNAEFHLAQMGRSIQGPERTGHTVAMEAAGAIVGNLWQQSFYAHLDAFLSAARSVPEVIKWCFGVDQNPRVKPRFDQLPAGELDRRNEFMKQFRAPYDAFCQRPLSGERNITVHRTGYPSVTVTIRGLFGEIYEGDPVTPVPIAETRKMDDPSFGWMAQPVPLQPMWQDFKINGLDLFPECAEHLLAARALAAEANSISTQVHGNNTLTLP
jgi:hypothetical protein